MHQATAFGNDLEAGLEIPDAGEGVGGQLAEGQTQAGLEVVELAAFLENLGNGVALDVEGRLADTGLGQELGRAFEAGLTEVERQYLGGAVVEVLGGSRTFVQRLTHTDDLGALTGEQESSGHQKEGGKKGGRVNGGEAERPSGWRLAVSGWVNSKKQRN